MITWHPHTEIPTGPETAVIAIRPPKGDPDEVDVILLAELHRFDMRWRCWMSEGMGLKIHHDVFWWARESEILQGVPT